MLKLRLYYECLEQALHFLKPMIESSFQVSGETNDIQLVKLPKSVDTVPDDSCFSAILLLVKPDALLTAVVGDEEIPLILFEFSMAVTTEDHELQRSFGACAAFFANMFYIKISGKKESTKEFGGAIFNPLSSPRIFLENLGWQGFIYSDWEVVDKNPQILKTSENFLSCPHEMPLVCDVIHEAVQGVINNKVGWFDRALKALKNNERYLSYRTKVMEASGLQYLLDQWKTRQARVSKLSQLRYFIDDDSVAVKINRFTHAMDPDRGIIIFTSLGFSYSRKIFGVYALVRQRTKNMKLPFDDIAELRKRIQTSLNSVDIGGIPKWLSLEIQNAANQVSNMDEIVDFQHVVNKNANLILKSRVATALIYFLDGLRLSYNGPLLKWNRRALFKNTTEKNINELVRQRLGFHKHWRPNPIRLVDDIDEDEVNYIFIHRFLIPNNFRLITVSYPGAQGDTPILPNPKLGKKQPREYLDAIALFPGRVLIVLLNESKGKFTKQAIEADCRKLIAYKIDADKETALMKTLSSNKFINNKEKLSSIIVGVSFGGTATDNWHPEKVDFIFSANRERWKICIFSQELKDVVTQYEGQSYLLPVYQIDM